MGLPWPFARATCFFPPFVLFLQPPKILEVAAGLEPAKTGFADQRLGRFGIATSNANPDPTHATPRSSAFIPLLPRPGGKHRHDTALATQIQKTKNPSTKHSGDGFQLRQAKRFSLVV